MYIVFTGIGYRAFSDENAALEFCEKYGITWIDCGGWEQFFVVEGAEVVC